MRSVTTNGNKDLLLGAEGCWDRVCRSQALAMVMPWFRGVETAAGWPASHWATLVRNGIQQLGGQEWQRRKENLLV